QQAKENLDRKNARELHKTREKLLEQQEAIAELKAFYDKVCNQWGDLGLRNLGHVRYAKVISVGGRKLYTED
ncbi:hypothetical protein FRB97_002562, partial [Tulasnella sp. 331]